MTILAEIRKTQAPIVNPGLVKAMDAMKQERNQRNEMAFANMLKASRFLVPANINSVQAAQANEDGTVELKEQPQVRFLLFNNKDGDKYFPLFTDSGELSKWDEYKKYQLAAVTYRDLCQFLQNNRQQDIAGAVINPFGQNIMVPYETLLRIMNTEAIAPGTKIQIGTLKEEPIELTDALRAHLETLPEVSKAYLRMMKREDKPNANLLLILDMDTSIGETAIKAMFDGIAEVAKPHLKNVEFAIVPSTNNFGKAALKDAVPFYEV